MVVRWLIAAAAALAPAAGLGCSGSSTGADTSGLDGSAGSTGEAHSSGTVRSSTLASSARTSRSSETSSVHGSASSSERSSPSQSSSAGAADGGVGLFAHCSLTAGCLADCSPPEDDPIATGNAAFDLYDGCILAGMKLAGMTQVWQGQLLKSQAYNESGITPTITTNDDECGGQNCGIYAISAGSVSGDSPPGPCGSSAKDPFTGEVDYSHSYGLFQETPACEGTFISPTLPPGHTCTGTTEANNIPFSASTITFYCESATSLGVSSNTGTGTVKGYINAVQDPSDPLYATSIFNPAYQLYVYLDHTWASNFQQANAGASGCTEVEQWYLSLAYWLTGDPTTSCTLTGDGLQYVQTAISDYESTLYNKPWPYPGP